MDLGLISYQEAYEQQKRSVRECLRTGRTVLLCCEHPPVITLGRMSKREHLLASDEELKIKNVACVAIDRGGDITLHAPGQLVMYPIIDLKRYKQDLHWYLKMLEDVTVRTLRDFGLPAEVWEGKTGVYVKRRKIASIGIGVRRWVTYHGVGINVATDLELFRLIKPCGLDVTMTSLKEALKRDIALDEVKEKWVHHFKEKFHA